MSSSANDNVNGYLECIYERSQKLTEALYRVTDLFADSEPLKWLLRKDGLEIFESLLKVKTAHINERSKGLSNIAEKIRQLIKVFELAASGSFISDANFQVLKKRYSELADYLSERKADILPEPSADGFIGQNTIGQLSNGLKIKEEEPISYSNEKMIENTLENSELVTSKENQIVKPTRENRNGNGTDRRGEILSLIKEKDWVSVGELADAFSGKVGEKTLQRDLVSMASEGLLLKEGEKRWRRYKLAA